MEGFTPIYVVMKRLSWLRAGAGSHIVQPPSKMLVSSWWDALSGSDQILDICFSFFRLLAVISRPQLWPRGFMSFGPFGIWVSLFSRHLNHLLSDSWVPTLTRHVVVPPQKGMAQSFAPKINELIELARRANLELAVRLHVTTSLQTIYNPIQFSEVVQERPDMSSIIRDALGCTVSAIERRGGSRGSGLAVGICGPMPMIASLRNAVADADQNLASKAGGISVHSCVWLPPYLFILSYLKVKYRLWRGWLTKIGSSSFQWIIRLVKKQNFSTQRLFWCWVFENVYPSNSSPATMYPISPIVLLLLSLAFNNFLHSAFRYAQ